MHVVMRESWTDERLDEFAKRIDERFDRVDERFENVDRRFEQADERFDQMDKRFDGIEERLIAMQQEATDRTLSQNRMMVFAVLALSSAYMAGFAALVTQV
jgi:DNA anti-recombination protein RmuC